MARTVGDAVELGHVVVAVAGGVRFAVIVAAVDAAVGCDVHGAVLQEAHLVDVCVDAVGEAWRVEWRSGRFSLLEGT